MRNEEFGEEALEGRIALSELTKKIIVQTVYFFVAMLSASNPVQQYFSPLGIAFCSSVDRQNTLFSCFGAMAGYLLTNEYVSAFRYVMALIMVYILKVYTNTFPALRQKIFVPCIISLFATLSTGLVAMITSPFEVKDVLWQVAEAVTALGGAYFFTTGFSAVGRLKENGGITTKELTATVISVMLIILSSSRLSLLGITPSGVACSYIILISAYLFRESGGAIIGTGASLGFVMTGNSLPSVFCYAGAGLFSGLFSYSGRVLCAFAYIFAYGAMYVFFDGDLKNPAPFIETALASVFFMLTPSGLLIKAKSRLSVISLAGEGRAVESLMTFKIKAVRNAVTSISEALSRVSEHLKEKALPDTAFVYLKVRDKVCSDCGSYGKCWRNNPSVTIGDFDRILEEIRKSGSITPSGAPASFQGKCIRIMSLCDSFNKNYASYSARLGAEGRINEMRKITSDQYSTVCEMLDDLLRDFEKGAKLLVTGTDALKNSLDELGAQGHVNCYEGEGQNMLVNITLDIKCAVPDEEIKNCIEKVTEKDFMMPVTLRSEKEKTLLFCQKTRFTAECVFFQLSAKTDEPCGDCFESFYDGRGNFVAVLSDGMGTGESAALDGSMTASLFSKLIISGFSFPCALRLVNSAMLVKGCDESLATLDIVKINLYNGRTTICKAGAAPSLLYRNNKVSEIKKSAMPIGILRQTEFATVTGKVYPEDVLVIMSDGATEASMEEVKAYITEKGFSYDLPERLCALARGKSPVHRDDITVAVIKLKENDD